MDVQYSIETIPQGRVSAKWGVVWSAHSGFLEGPVRNKGHLDFSRLPTEKPMNLAQGCFVAFNSQWGNHYHILTEWIGALFDYASLGLESLSPRILLPQSAASNGFLSSALQYLGLADRVVWLDDAHDAIIEAPLVLYPGILHGEISYRVTNERVSRFQDWGAWEVAKRGLVNVGVDRIYVSRVDSNFRRLLNEVDVIRDLVSSRGFVAMNMRNVPPALQMALFSNAHTIVAPHGAGLTNLVFRGTSEMRTVLELQPHSYQNPCFKVISAALGDPHMAVVGSDSPMSAGEHQHEISYTLEPRVVVETLDQALGLSEHGL